ncbi:hypothetical protein THAOC_21159 [Thalassiosira oceanica]|uniref:Major facilitator superfamily (MFS) profile domain-containing protein n=1 Tax=Thalassiosira oceanica TaxID=159749 RepID=K0S0A1_THAOC|nr:hypothetical protein THAOC_21159 [Thalassiosira oceanica]|eukprot:EJK58695.1 hypothetical protein THAOC_21159 [Thalassiosira oceanica]
MRTGTGGRRPHSRPLLPPSALRWSAASSVAAAVSYADRGTSAVAASSLLDSLGWSESQLGGVQSAFFAGYALTQVAGGVLAGGGAGRRDAVGGEEDGLRLMDGGGRLTGGRSSGRRRDGERFRSVLPLSLFLTGIATLLFPLAASAGPAWASADRFCLGLMEGLRRRESDDEADAEGGSSDYGHGGTGGGRADVKATASSIVIAGCYLGSAWAYLSAWGLYSPGLPAGCRLDVETRSGLAAGAKDLLSDTVDVARETVLSRSGRAILAAQVGQGALLYSIASWGPLYLERLGPTQGEVADAAAAGASDLPPGVSAVAVTASAAAASLILPQIAQAAVGVGVGTAADGLSTRIGTRTTRRALQVVSGVGPALVLVALTRPGVATAGTEGLEQLLLPPAVLFGAAQTLSALSLGAVSVSHLDVASPPKAGSVYALGNVAAAVSGSAMVSLFGMLLDGAAQTSSSSASAAVAAASADEFALPFRIVALVSAVGSIWYGLTVESDVEIGSAATAGGTNRKDR